MMLYGLWLTMGGNHHCYLLVTYVCGGHLLLFINHCLSSSCGGFPSIRHNEMYDITAAFWTETNYANFLT